MQRRKKTKEILYETFGTHISRIAGEFASNLICRVSYGAGTSAAKLI